MPAKRPSSRRSWWPWIIGGGAAAIIAVIATHLSEARAALEAAWRADGRWLLVATALQAGTYLSEAEVWREVTCRAGCSVTLLKAAQIALARLFVDQTLPTGGVSGSALAAAALAEHGLSPHAVAATVVIERASYLAAYDVALMSATVLGMRSGHINGWILGTALTFGVAAAAIVVGLLRLAGHRGWRVPRVLRRVPVVRGVIVVMRRADPRIVRDIRLFVLASALQTIEIALDTATMLAVVRAVGAHIPLVSVFVSFMTSSLFRTIGALPGGVGTFEASSVFTLRLAGASMPVAISATMLFRGLSFWLPMAPGLWFARHTLRPHDAIDSRPDPGRRARSAKTKTRGRIADVKS